MSLLLAAAAPCGTAIIPNGVGLGDPEPPTGLNPLLLASTDALQTAILLYRPLVWIGHDMTFDRENSLAASVTALDGNSRFRVTLKPWRWSDGVPITPDDVLFGWERIGKLGAAYPEAGQGGIPDRVAELRLAGPAEIDFVLKKPTNPDWFTLNGLSLIYALPRHAWGDIDAAAMRRRQNDPSLYQVVDGPFRLAAWQPDRYAAYIPNPRYGGHAALLRRLVVTFPAAGALHALEAGELDMARVPYALWPRLQGTPGFHVIELPEAYGYWALSFNLRDAAPAFLRDPAVRRAFADAIDQPEIIRLAYHGLGAENHLAAPAAASVWRGPTPAAGHRPDRARAALEKAGWPPGPRADSVRLRHGVPLRFTVITGADPDSPEMQALQVVQSNLRAIGVEMRLHAMASDQLTDIIFDPDARWDAASVFITLPPVPDGTGYFDTGGAENFGGYTDARMDRLIHDSVDKSGADALSALHAYQAYAADRLPAIILPQGALPIMVADRLHGAEGFSNAAGFWTPETLSVDDPACRAGAAAALP